MQKVKRISAKHITDLEQNISDFIDIFEADVKIMSIVHDPVMDSFHAMLIYEEK